MKVEIRDVLAALLRRLAGQPAVEELRAGLERLPPFHPSVSPTRVIRAERDSR